MTATYLAYFVLFLSLGLTIQGAFTLYLMLYTWARPQRLRASRSPDRFEAPRLAFTAILPCKNEQAVIAHTIQRVWDANYPKHLLEVVVVCEQTDVETIAEAQRAINAIGHPNLRVLTFNTKPVNKPHGLNVALRGTRHEVITIFDAEDDVHPDIFNIVNTIMLRQHASIVQAGVQLMDFQSTWFAMHNVLEYFFWFKSRLHFHAQVGAVPLGGNTVFMQRRLIEGVNGWDEHCLTEDADVGIRLSVKGERIAVTYDAAHATREETPPTLAHFIKQRTRWNQGFLQVLGKRDWLQLPRWPQRVLAGYTLIYPFVQAVVGVLWLPTLLMMFTLKVPVPLAMLSVLPLYALMFQYLVNFVGLFEFASVYGTRVRLRDAIVFTLGFLPYQVLLSIGAIRAVYRHVRGVNNWEKTMHTGAHRQPVPAAQPTPAVPFVPVAQPQPALRGVSVTQQLGDGQFIGAPHRFGATGRLDDRHPIATTQWLGTTRRLDDGQPGFASTASFVHLLRAAHQQLGIDRSSVLVRAPGENELRLQASYGLPREAHNVRVRVGDGVAGWVAQTKSPVLLNDGDVPRALHQRLMRPELRSALVVPVEQAGETVAVVSLASHERDLDEHDFSWLVDQIEDVFGVDAHTSEMLQAV